MLRPLEGSDSSVQGTNDDAQVSKMSCAKAGYFKDEFIQYFVRRASRRSPLINRGYYSRHAALRQLLERFLAAAAAVGQPPQVLVLGAGFDTSWFQLSCDRGAAPYKCLEVDFKEVTQRKAAVIAKEAALSSLLRPAAPPQPPPGGSPAAAAAAATSEPSNASQPCGRNDPNSTAAATAIAVVASSSPPAVGGSGSAEPVVAAAAPGPSGQEARPAAADAAAVLDPVTMDVGGGRVLSPHYCLLPVDLRHVGALEAAVQEAGFDSRLPTYVLSECVLVYMEPAHSNAVVAWAAATFQNAVMAIYEQIRPDDAFGRQMVSNLELRGCPLRGLPATPSLEAHCDRLRAAGWSVAEARDMDNLYRSFLAPGDKARVERLEIFDELEEWHMIQEHYCIALGRNDQEGWLRGVGFEPAP